MGAFTANDNARWQKLYKRIQRRIIWILVSTITGKHLKSNSTPNACPIYGYPHPPNHYTLKMAIAICAETDNFQDLTTHIPEIKSYTSLEIMCSQFFVHEILICYCRSQICFVTLLNFRKIFSYSSSVPSMEYHPKRGCILLLPGHFNDPLHIYTVCN